MVWGVSAGSSTTEIKSVSFSDRLVVMIASFFPVRMDRELHAMWLDVLLEVDNEHGHSKRVDKLAETLGMFWPGMDKEIWVNVSYLFPNPPNPSS